MSDKQGADNTALKEPTLVGTLERIAAALEAQTEAIDDLSQELSYGFQELLKRKSGCVR